MAEGKTNAVLSINFENKVLITEPSYTTNWPVPPFENSYETLTPADYTTISYSYEIT